MSDFSKSFGSFGSFAGSVANSGLTSAADSFLSGLSNSIFGGITAKRDWKYRQKEMALQQEYNLQNMQKQYDYQLDFWNKQNQYNDPSNAVARWRNAGVSPQSVFGSSPGGAGVAGGSVSVPNSENPHASGVNQRGLAGMTLAEAAMMRNQQKLTDAEVDLKAAQAEYYRENAQGQRNENSLFDLTRRIREAGAISAEQQARQDTLDTEFAEWNQDNRKRLSEETLANFETQRNKMNQEISESVSREASNMMGIREALSRVTLNNIQVALMKSQIRLNDKNIELITNQIQKIVSDIALNDASIYLKAAQTSEANQRSISVMIENIKDRDFYGILNDGTQTFSGSFNAFLEKAIDALSPFAK